MATATQIKEFIQKLGKLAVAECNRRITLKQGFVLPSVCIAQSALETGWGTAGIMTRANAFFGIKAGGSWTGAVYRADTWEVANGESYNTTANFRAYSSLEESVRDYYDLIGNASRYSDALSYDMTNWKTPRQCITAIWSGGYATDTLYVEKIMSTIDARNLAEWDSKIDGVSVSLGNHSFTASDFMNGILDTADSNRTIVNAQTDNKRYIAINWDKAPTMNADGTYTILLNGLPLLSNEFIENAFIRTLTGDTPAIWTVKDDSTITVRSGEKVGLYVELNTEKTPSELFGTGELIYQSDQSIYDSIDNSERYNVPIAFFVEIK